MSKYTTEVRYICETYAGYSESQGGSSVNSIIEKSRDKIFDFDYPIFDPSYKSVIETKIIRHFYTREIGMETVALWKLRLCTKMNEIMPLYNQYYKSELLEFNPFYDVDLTREQTTTKNGNVDKSEDSNTDTSRKTTDTTSTVSEVNSNTTDEANGTTNENSNTGNKDLYSDTPQGTIANLEGQTYLTNARITSGDNSGTRVENKNANSNTKSDANTDVNYESEGSTNSTNTVNSVTKINDTIDYLESVKGKSGGQNYSELLIKYRQTFMNIDMMVIDELEELFMQLW